MRAAHGREFSRARGGPSRAEAGHPEALHQLGAAGPSARLSVKVISEDYQRWASEGLPSSSGSRAGGVGEEGT